MKMLYINNILTTLIVAAALCPSIAFAEQSTADNPTSTKKQPAMETPAMASPPGTNAGDFDRPQSIAPAEERLLQLQYELAAAERTLARLQARMGNSLQAAEQEALRAKITEQQSLQEQLEREIRKQEQVLQSLSAE